MKSGIVLIEMIVCILKPSHLFKEVCIEQEAHLIQGEPKVKKRVLCEMVRIDSGCNVVEKEKQELECDFYRVRRQEMQVMTS